MRRSAHRLGFMSAVLASMLTMATLATPRSPAKMARLHMFTLPRTGMCISS